MRDDISEMLAIVFIMWIYIFGFILFFMLPIAGIVYTINWIVD